MLSVFAECEDALPDSTRSIVQSISLAVRAMKCRMAILDAGRVPGGAASNSVHDSHVHAVGTHWVLAYCCRNGHWACTQGAG